MIWERYDIDGRGNGRLPRGAYRRSGWHGAIVLHKIGPLSEGVGGTLFLGRLGADMS